jgi:hypothetical protein
VLAAQNKEHRPFVPANRAGDLRTGRNPEKHFWFLRYAVSKDLARQEAETPPGTAGVGRRCPRNLVGAGRAGPVSVMAGIGDRNRKRLPLVPLALPPAIA